MKKTLVLTILGVAAGTMASYAQEIYFSNYFSSSSPTIKFAASVIPGTKDNLAVGGSLYAELFYDNAVTANANAVTNPLASSITYFSNGGPAQNATADGDLADGAGFFYGSGQIVTGNTESEATFRVEVFGTEGGNSYFGESALFNMTPATGSTPVPGLNQGSGSVYQANNPGAVGFANFTVTNVPEPTTMALVGLGTLGMLALRRRKA
jgi:hypothetical protein